MALPIILERSDPGSNPVVRAFVLDLFLSSHRANGDAYNVHLRVALQRRLTLQTVATPMDSFVAPPDGTRCPRPPPFVDAANTLHQLDALLSTRKL